MARHAQIAQNNKFAISLQYLIKNGVVKLVFCLQISIKVSYKLTLWFFMGMVKYSQSSQNSKFAISLRYLQKKVRDGVDILHPNKRINTKVSYKLISYLTSMIKHSQSIQSGKFVISLQYLQKKSYTRNGVLHADKH